MGDEVQPLDGSHFELQRDATEIARARQLVGRFLAGSPSEVVTIAQLLVSELVTNALEHGSGRIRLRLDCTDDVLRVHVTDDSSRRPTIHRSPRDRERGRGLLMVESLATAWGIAPAVAGPGKSVWFSLRAR